MISIPILKSPPDPDSKTKEINKSSNSSGGGITTTLTSTGQQDSNTGESGKEERSFSIDDLNANLITNNSSTELNRTPLFNNQLNTTSSSSLSTFQSIPTNNNNSASSSANVISIPPKLPNPTLTPEEQEEKYKEALRVFQEEQRQIILKHQRKHQLQRQQRQQQQHQQQLQQHQLQHQQQQLQNQQQLQQESNPTLYGRSLEAMRLAASMMKRSDEVWQEIYAQQQQKQQQLQQQQQQQQNRSTDESQNNNQSTSRLSPQSRAGGGGGSGSNTGNAHSKNGEMTDNSNEVDGHIERNTISNQSNVNFSTLMSENSSVQHPIINTPLQPGAAALLSMTDSYEHSSSILQPKDSEKAYKPVKMKFSDPFASTNNKERDPKITMDANQTEGDSRQINTRGGSRASKRTYSRSKMDHGKNDSQPEKRERLENETTTTTTTTMNETLSDNLDADGEFEIAKSDDVNFITTTSSENQIVRGRGSSGNSKGKTGGGGGGGGRQATGQRKTPTKARNTRGKKVVIVNETKETNEVVVNNESTDNAENQESTSSVDNSAGLIEGAQEAVGQLMQQEQEWQQMLEMTQRENEEKKRLQQTQELEQILRQDMALKMQQATAQSWNQAYLPQPQQPPPQQHQQHQQAQLSFQQTANLFNNPAAWLFNQPLNEKFDQNALMGFQQASGSTNSIALPSSSADTMENVFPQTEYLEIEPGQFQSMPMVSQMNMPTQSVNTVKVTPDVSIHPHVSVPAATVAPMQASASTKTASAIHPNFNSVVSSQPGSSNAILVGQNQIVHHNQSSTQQNTANMPRNQQNESNNNSDKNTHFILTDHGSINGELSWKIDDQDGCQRLAGKFYLTRNAPFPIRPLNEEAVKQIHSDWLDSHTTDGFRSGGVGVPTFTTTSYNGSGEETQKKFPTVETTRESILLREVWQDLERRRILYLNDPNLLEYLRKEAASELKREAAQRAMFSASVTNALTWATIATQEPPSQEVEIRAKMNWERQKSAAAYTVGLLRQAEYCVSEGTKAFTPFSGGGGIGNGLGQTISSIINMSRNEAAMTFFGSTNEAALLHSLNVQGNNRPQLPTTPVPMKRGGGGGGSNVPIGIKRENDYNNNVYSATLPHGGSVAGGSVVGADDTVLGSPSILAQSTAVSVSVSPAISTQAQPAESTIAPERKNSNDSWDTSMMNK